MNNEEHVLLEWSYSPERFFEEPIVVSLEGVEIRIEGGTATAKVEPEVYDAEHKKRDELHDVVRGYFKAEQVMTHKSYTLSQSTLKRSRDVTIFVPTVYSTMTIYPPDIRITDTEGNVITDTKRERLERKREFRDACERVRDDWVLRRMLASYGGGVNDPEDELIHLYELRDALSTHFKGSDKARKNLGIPKKSWNRLGEIANTMPLRQGRHRGEHDELRDATAEELQEARALAREFIEAYVRFLEGKGA